MSTLVVSNISDGTTTVGASYVTNGSAKAWVNFDGTGTIAARDSLNLSSLTDNGTGDYSANLTTAMANDDYSFTTAPNASTGNAPVDICFNRSRLNTATAYNFDSKQGGIRLDTQWVFGVLQGELA